MEDINYKRKVFIELARQFIACANAQRDWSEDTFQECFNISKDESLLINIKLFREKLFDIDE